MAYSNTASLYYLTISTFLQSFILTILYDNSFKKVSYFDVFIILVNQENNLLVLLLNLEYIKLSIYNNLK